MKNIKINKMNVKIITFWLSMFWFLLGTVNFFIDNKEAEYYNFIMFAIYFCTSCILSKIDDRKNDY